MCDRLKSNIMPNMSKKSTTNSPRWSCINNILLHNLMSLLSINNLMESASNKSACKNLKLLPSL